MKNLFLTLHNGFFEDDDNNLKTVVAGFVISTVCILTVFGLYQL